MSNRFTDRLPSIFPKGTVTVEEEKVFQTYRLQDGTRHPQLAYELNKGPINYIKSVEAEVDGDLETLEEDTDYQLGPDKEQIEFGIGGVNPDNDTQFTVTYVAESIISRYTDEHTKIFDKTEDHIDNSVTTNHVDKATGAELDRIGRIFGALGRRSGRTDSQYRSYLKSIVQSFSGRGTVDGVKFAVSSGLGPSVPQDEVTLVENFEENEYEIEIENFGDLEGINLATVNELAELADPSGVNLRLINFGFDPVTSSLVGDDVLAEQTIEAVRVAHVNDDDRVQIDVNSLLSADPNTFTSVEEQTQTDFNRFRTDKVLGASWNTGGTIQIDVHDDDNTPISSANKFEVQNDDEQVTDDTQSQQTEEVKVATADYGRDQIDTTDDGTEAIGPDPESFETSSEQVSDDESAVRTDQLQTAHYETGKHEIDLYNLLNDDLDTLVTSEMAGDDTQSQQVDAVQIATSSYGIGQIHVSDDGSTTISGDDPESFESSSEFVTDDAQAQRTDALAVSYYDEGKYAIDVQNLLDAELNRLEEDTQVSDDSKNYVTEEVQVSTVGAGRGNIDLAWDPNTSLITNDPETFPTVTSEMVGDDDENLTIEQVQAAHYEDGRQSIDLNNLSSSSVEKFRADSLVTDDTETTTVEEVQVASADYGRGQIDVSYDPNTTVIGDDPDSFTATSDGVSDDDQNQTVNEVHIASYNYGIQQIHVSDDGSTTVSGTSSPSSFTSDSDGVGDDTESETIEAVQEAYVNEARVQIDTADG